MKTTIRTKRVYDPVEKSDGFRVLVDRLWPRGIKKENLAYDLWIKDLTPSTELREWFHADPENRWTEFKKKYAKELSASPALPGFLETLRKHDVVTLLYAARDTEHNQALVLKAFFEKALA